MAPKQIYERIRVNYRDAFQELMTFFRNFGFAELFGRAKRNKFRVLLHSEKLK